MRHTEGKDRKRSGKQACLDFDVRRGRRVCSGCGIEKRFSFSHQRPEGKKMFSDDLDRLWVGSRCSECGPAPASAGKRKKRGEGYAQGSQRATFNRVEGMIARYFILKRKRKL